MSTDDHQPIPEPEADWSPTLGREPLKALTKLLFGGPRKLPTDECIANEALAQALAERELERRHNRRLHSVPDPGTPGDTGEGEK